MITKPKNSDYHLDISFGGMRIRRSTKCTSRLAARMLERACLIELIYIHGARKESVEVGTAPFPKPKVLIKEEVERYQMVAPQPVHDVIAIMLEIGRRVGEVLKIRKEDVFFETSAEDSESQGFIRIAGGKSSAEHTVPLTEKSSAILQSRMKEANSTYLFPHKKDGFRGSAYRNKISFQYNRELKKSGTRFRLHDRRSTLCAKAMEAEADPEKIARLLRSSKPFD